MHFITGGAFNGKRAWVKKTYQVDQHDGWVSAYESQKLPQNLTDFNQDFVVLEGIEIWLKILTEDYDINHSRTTWNTCLNDWLCWEKNGSGRNLVLIGTDISKGIVPLEKEKRIWRDLTGWVYQDTAAKAKKMDVIWYGLNQSIK
ncbi:MAG: bifunctional adenosylcobinamide kinase/adenosylcobinamide-phosphate guanylyltransferase [Bacillota bacterium]|nr:bifunctional adenosylcobinamide kinase/adenosylcobinamide-phosphate guanylyltransferase [Bacillota bacterium]